MKRNSIFLKHGKLIISLTLLMFTFFSFTSFNNKNQKDIKVDSSENTLQTNDPTQTLNCADNDGDNNCGSIGFIFNYSNPRVNTQSIGYDARLDIEAGVCGDYFYEVNLAEVGTEFIPPENEWIRLVNEYTCTPDSGKAVVFNNLTPETTYFPWGRGDWNAGGAGGGGPGGTDHWTKGAIQNGDPVWTTQSAVKNVNIVQVNNNTIELTFDYSYQIPVVGFSGNKVYYSQDKVNWILLDSDFQNGKSYSYTFTNVTIPTYPSSIYFSSLDDPTKSDLPLTYTVPSNKYPNNEYFTFVETNFESDYNSVSFEIIKESDDIIPNNRVYWSVSTTSAYESTTFIPMDYIEFEHAITDQTSGIITYDGLQPATSYYLTFVIQNVITDDPISQINLAPPEMGYTNDDAIYNSGQIVKEIPFQTYGEVDILSYIPTLTTSSSVVMPVEFKSIKEGEKVYYSLDNQATWTEYPGFLPNSKIDLKLENLKPYQDYTLYLASGISPTEIHSEIKSISFKTAGISSLDNLNVVEDENGEIYCEVDFTYSGLVGEVNPEIIYAGYSTDGGVTWENIKTLEISQNGSYSIIVDNLEPFSTYEIAVSSTPDFTDNTLSKEIMTTATFIVDENPSSIVDVTTNSITFQYEALKPHEIGYYSLDGGLTWNEFEITNNINEEKGTYTIDNLEYNTSYHLVLTPNPDFNTRFDLGMVSTVGPLTSIKAIESTSSTMTFTYDWDENAGSNYSPIVSSDGGVTWQKMNPEDEKVILTNLTKETNYSDGILDSNNDGINDEIIFGLSNINSSEPIAIYNYIKINNASTLASTSDLMLIDNGDGTLEMIMNAEQYKNETYSLQITDNSQTSSKQKSTNPPIMVTGNEIKYNSSIGGTQTFVLGNIPPTGSRQQVKYTISGFADGHSYSFKFLINGVEDSDVWSPQSPINGQNVVINVPRTPEQQFYAILTLCLVLFVILIILPLVIYFWIKNHNKAKNTPLLPKNIKTPFNT